MATLFRLHEVILYVESMERQVEFYRDVMGLTLLDPRGSDDWENEAWVALDAGGCKLCLHAGGAGDIGGDAPKIVFLVDDIAMARTRLLGHNVSMEPIFSPAPGVIVSNGFDPEGNPFSIEAKAS
ncbi:VOC family protein [Planctomycetes bacterium Pan216]